VAGGRWSGVAPHGKGGMPERCGAKNRQGNPCQKWPVAGSKRCRNHGGRSTGPKTAKGLARAVEAATDTGVYAKRTTYQRLLAAAQPEVFDAISSGNDLTDEIKWARAQIAALTATSLGAKEVAQLVGALTTLLQKQADLNPAGDSTGELLLKVQVIDGRKVPPRPAEGA
jgi:hypothetical protein